MLIKRNQEPGIVAQVLRAGCERAASEETEETVEAKPLTPLEQERKDEAEAILLKPQPESRGSVDGIEI